MAAAVLVPDLAGWRRAQTPGLRDPARLRLAPGWACAVLSPATRPADLADKRDVQAEHGGGQLCFVDPDARTLEACALQGGRWALLAALRDDAEVRVAPVEAVAFSLASLRAT